MASFAAERELTNRLANPGGACPGTIATNVGWDEAIDKDLNKDLTKLAGAGGLNPDFLVRDLASIRCRCLTGAESRHTTAPAGAAGELDAPKLSKAKCVFKKTPDLDTRTPRKRRRRHTSGRRSSPLRDNNCVDVGILEIYMIYQQVLGRSCSGPRRSNRGVPICRCSKAT
jgi:hypothetical protein